MNVKLKVLGILVTINNSLPVVAYPLRQPFVKDGVKQFWFIYGSRYMLARLTETGWQSK